MTTEARRIYLDHHATTPVDPRVVQAMLPHFTESFGNASSRSHRFGWDADQAVRASRAEIASLIGARSPREIVFTSGATESNNLALVGALTHLAGAEARDLSGMHILCSAIEHACVLETCRYLQSRGAEWTQLGVDAHGRVSASDVEAAIRPNTALISVMAVNNEVGTIQPLEEIGRIARKHGVLFHTDAAQAAGRIDIDVERDQIDLLSLSSHKLYGPKGVGALYVRRVAGRVRLVAQQRGGGQESGLRSGTLNVPGIVGFGEAARLVRQELHANEQRLLGLRSHLHASLRSGIPDLRLHGGLCDRVAGNLSFSVPGIDGEQLLAAIPEVAMSAGSACSSGKVEVSHVLQAMGIPFEVARGAVRIGLGRTTSLEDVQYAVARLIAVASRLRGPRRMPSHGKDGAGAVPAPPRTFTNLHRGAALEKHSAVSL